MKNILYIHNHYQISGGEQSLLYLWKNMNRRKYQPHLLIPGNGVFQEEAARLKIKVSHFSVPKIRMRNIKKFFFTTKNLGNYCRINNIKLIHSYSPRNNVLSSLIGMVLKIPVVWHERNIPYGNERDISRLLKFLPDQIICNSRAVAERFRVNGKISKKVRIILNGVETSDFAPKKIIENKESRSNSADKKIVGLISNLSKRKKPEDLFNICPLVINYFPHVEFWVIGGEYGSEEHGRMMFLKEQAKVHGLENHIKFTGYVHNVCEVIPKFDVGIALTENEACSRAILEIMSSGKPVVAFETGGNSELIVNGVTGFLIEYGNYSDFANVLIQLLKNDNRRKRFGKQARKRVEKHFDVRVNVSKTEEIYRKLIC